MAVQAPPVSIAKKPFWRRRQFWRVTLPVIAAVSLFGSGIVVYDSLEGSNGSPNAAKGWGVTYPSPSTVKPPTVALEAGAVNVARLFIQTAVARKNLVAAYRIAGPQVRQGMTLEQWRSGTIPVVPYKITAATSARFKTDYSYRNRARIEVLVATPGVKQQDFFVDLIKRDGRWLVNGWVPRWSPPIPVSGG